MNQQGKSVLVLDCSPKMSTRLRAFQKWSSDSKWRAAVEAVCFLIPPIVLCGFAFFYHLGAAALFEPDEGRNADKARDILLLNDWVTP
jgi:hypothetical protein